MNAMYELGLSIGDANFSNALFIMFAVKYSEDEGLTLTGKRFACQFH